MTFASVNYPQKSLSPEFFFLLLFFLLFFLFGEDATSLRGVLRFFLSPLHFWVPWQRSLLRVFRTYRVKEATEGVAHQGRDVYCSKVTQEYQLFWSDFSVCLSVYRSFKVHVHELNITLFEIDRLATCKDIHFLSSKKYKEWARFLLGRNILLPLRMYWP